MSRIRGRLAIVDFSGSHLRSPGSSSLLFPSSHLYHTLSSLRDCYRTSKRNADAYRIAKPEIGTTGTDGRVPLVELLKGDTELAVDLVAAIAALNRVVLVAVGCCAGLGRCRWTTSAASGSTRGSANAVRIAIRTSVKRDGSIL